MELVKTFKNSEWECYKCKKSGKNNLLHRHHITYDPEKIVTLCVNCHKQILFLNHYYKRVTKVELDNPFRELIFDRFMEYPDCNYSEDSLKGFINQYIDQSVAYKYKYPITPFAFKPKVLRRNQFVRGKYSPIAKSIRTVRNSYSREFSNFTNHEWQ